MSPYYSITRVKICIIQTRFVLCKYLLYKSSADLFDQTSSLLTKRCRDLKYLVVGYLSSTPIPSLPREHFVVENYLLVPFF